MEILERFQSKVLQIITDASWFVLNEVIICELLVLSVRQEVRNYSVTYRQRNTDHPNSLVKFLFQRPNYNTPPETITNHLWLNLNRKCITGCISYMPLLMTVNTIAECLRTDCNILGDKIIIKKKVFPESILLLNFTQIFAPPPSTSQARVCSVKHFS